MSPCLRGRGNTTSSDEDHSRVEKLRLDLPETERELSWRHLQGSLPSVLHDEDEGIAEALRRDAEFEANPSLGMTLEELDQRIENRRS